MLLTLVKSLSCDVNSLVPNACQLSAFKFFIERNGILKHHRDPAWVVGFAWNPLIGAAG
jgi:hypothetical protein